LYVGKNIKQTGEKLRSSARDTLFFRTISRTTYLEFPRDEIDSVLKNDDISMASQKYQHISEIVQTWIVVNSGEER